jgi:hypothetical protein
MNRCKNRKEFAEVVKYSTIFLLCGGIYSDVPNNKIKVVNFSYCELWITHRFRPIKSSEVGLPSEQKQKVPGFTPGTFCFRF